MTKTKRKRYTGKKTLAKCCVSFFVFAVGSWYWLSRKCDDRASSCGLKNEPDHKGHADATKTHTPTKKSWIGYFVVSRSCGTKTKTCTEWNSSRNWARFLKYRTNNTPVFFLRTLSSLSFFLFYLFRRNFISRKSSVGTAIKISR